MPEGHRPGPLAATPSAGRAITVDDLLALRIANDPQLSPDGSRVVCVLTEVDVAANAYRSHLWIVPVTGGDPWPLTAAAARDTTPRWSPDGREIAFLSDRGGAKQVWIIAPDGGEARQVTSGALSPSELAWAPDGRSLAFIGKPEPAAPDEPSDVRVFTRLRYKADGEGFWDGRWKQVFIVDLGTGDIRQVTHGDYDHTGPAWSPDGTRIAYTGNADADADLGNASDVWIVPVNAEAPPRRLTRTAGPAESPAWSPDGARIAYVGHDNPCRGASHARVWVVPATGGDPVCLTREYDRSVGHHLGSDVRGGPTAGGLTWSPEGTRIYTMVAEGGTTQIASVAPDGAVRLETRGDHELVGCSLDGTGRRLACIVCDPVTPGEVAVIDAGGSAPGPPRRLTRWNGPLLDGVALARPERFQCRGADGWPIEAWVMRPAGSRRIPAVLEIHGGPHAAYGCAFMYQFQLLCAAGYAVIYANPRGSRGYSEAFAAATHHDWGGKDYEDLMRVVDHALAHYSWIDPRRLGVAGGSYGGYMTNWIVGHTQRFRAAVSMRTTCDRAAQWGTSDIGYHNGQWEFPGAPWEAPEFYRERSPITYVREMRTPMLILHGEDDLRCPVAQSEQLFVALHKQGTPVLFVRFPGESHGMSSSGQPRHRLAQLRHILVWFEKYLAPD